MSYALFLGFAFCCLSWICGVILVAIDSYADKVDKKKAALGDDEKFKLSDVRQLGIAIWLMSLIIFFYDSIVFPYISNLMNPMLQIKYGFSEDKAATTVFLPYIISPFLCAPLGYLIDKTGRRVLYCKCPSINLCRHPWVADSAADVSDHSGAEGKHRP